MENTIDENFQMPSEPIAQRPEFLKILCILSFVACGLMILVSAIGTVCLAMDDATIDKIWPQIAASSPEMAEIDPYTFFHGIGMACLYSLIANVFSLIGVIMMWRLEKIGVIIYAIAELATNFFSTDIGLEKEKSYGGTIFMVVIDLVFIGMYVANIKYMNKKNNNTFIQSGS
ncbi:hypothetical protein CNR22_08765 [Sphingobacteriaceae bacterium]|nr:hypothetical protein CNR22_08765 [Sphingobacteriaceae bacterium]